jgi:UDP-glucose 6-dehydrogenase
MRIGVIGLGIVGGTLQRWFENHTIHELRLYDPPKGLNDSLEGCEAIFVSVPVDSYDYGQDLSILKGSVKLAKNHSNLVFIRSSVLPGTADELECISMPEFLTERTAYEDMCKLPVLTGECDENLIKRMFPGKPYIMVKNKEAELIKYAHNCFGAFKVTYFNMINELCERMCLNYESILKGIHLTGFIEKQHTKVPGPDGHHGYGGKCLPVNMQAMQFFLHQYLMPNEAQLFKRVIELNKKYREYGEQVTNEEEFTGAAI